jgi:hypothetical protein
VYWLVAGGGNETVGIAIAEGKFTPLNYLINTINKLIRAIQQEKADGS